MAVAHDQQSQFCAQAEQDEAILVGGMIGIVDQPGALIREYRFGIVKTDAMFPEIGGRLGGIPLESQFGHDAA